jgi:hypothetical protein
MSIFPVCTPDAISLVSPSFDETTKDVDLSDIVDLLSVAEDVSNFESNNSHFKDHFNWYR